MRRRSERGSTIPLIIGFAAVLALVIALVVDASAAYLRRSSLDTLADGAALRGADLGAAGTEVYGEGLSGDRLEQTRAAAQASVEAYLRAVGAYRTYPGLSARTAVDLNARTVRVQLTAPLSLPLHVPGSPQRPSIGATGSAEVTIDR